MFLTHLRRNVVAYLALVVALGTGTAFAAAAIPNGSVTAAKLHTNAVTSNKIKNGAIKPKDIKKPTYVQSTTLGAGTPPAPSRTWSASRPTSSRCRTKGRTSVTVFIPTIGGDCDTGNADQPTIGLYIDNVPIAGTRGQRARRGQRPRRSSSPPRSSSSGGAHAGRVGITCSGASRPTNSELARCQVLDDHPGRLRSHGRRETPHPARASGSGCGGSRAGVVQW